MQGQRSTKKNVAAARKRVAELQHFKNQIVKKWIANEITKDVYDDQMIQVGTQLETAGLAEGHAVLELAEVEGCELGDEQRLDV